MGVEQPGCDRAGLALGMGKGGTFPELGCVGEDGNHEFIP